MSLLHNCLFHTNIDSQYSQMFHLMGYFKWTVTVVFSLNYLFTLHPNHSPLSSLFPVTPLQFLFLLPHPLLREGKPPWVSPLCRHLVPASVGIFSSTVAKPGGSSMGEGDPMTGNRDWDSSHPTC